MPLVAVDEFLAASRAICIGKRLPDSVYLHESLVSHLPPAMKSIVARLSELGLSNEPWNILRIGTNRPELALLLYPGFDTEAYPKLAQSVRVDLRSGKTSKREFPQDDRAFVLHRKELLVAESYPLYEEFSLISQEGQAAGLYGDGSRIGVFRRWVEHIEEHGYELVDGRLFRRSSGAPHEWGADRWRTALRRYAPSVPMQMMQGYGWLDGSLSLLDYGCGLGDDLAFLSELGVRAWGWDPYHQPDGSREEADVVNLGYVLNVIEDPEERADALRLAFGRARKAIVVSAMVASAAHIARFRPHGDGVLTSRNTFQKYFSQQELRDYVEAILGVSPIGLTTGVVVAFRDEAFRERFDEARFTRRSISYSRRVVAPRPTAAKRRQRLAEENEELCNKMWVTLLDLGRPPDESETELYSQLAEVFGSPKRGLEAVLEYYGAEPLEEAQRLRREDLLVAEAVARLERRARKLSVYSPVRQRDIRYHFGSLKELQSQVDELLGVIAQADTLGKAAESIDRETAGGLTTNDAVYVERRCIERLPVELRVYAELAAAYHGGYGAADVVKIHLHSGKLSLMHYDGFADSPLPILAHRTKVNLRRQRIDEFEYGRGYLGPPLYWKSMILAPDAPDLEKQRSFDRRLDDLGLAPEPGANDGFSTALIDEILAAKGLQIRGYRFFKIASSQ